MEEMVLGNGGYPEMVLEFIRSSTSKIFSGNRQLQEGITL